MHYVVPLNNRPNQTFKITIPVDGENKTFKLKFCYNGIGKYWMLSILDIRGKTIVSNINLVCTAGPVSSNIIKSLDYMRIGSIYVVDVDAYTWCMPDDTQLGDHYKVLWGDTP